jgi:hypothetical protein
LLIVAVVVLVLLVIHQFSRIADLQAELREMQRRSGR